MKNKLIIFFLVAITSVGNGQSTNYDSAKYLSVNNRDDSTRFEYYNNVFYSYVFSHPDSAAPYVRKELILALQMNDQHTLAVAYNSYAWLHVITSNYSEAIQAALKGLKAAENSSDFSDLSDAYDMLGYIYTDQGNFELAIRYTNMAKSVLESNGISPSAIKSFSNAGDSYASLMNSLTSIYTKSNRLDSALKYAQLFRSIEITLYGKVDWAPVPSLFGDIYFKLKRYGEAIEYYHSAVALAATRDNGKDLMDGYLGLAKAFVKTGQIDSALFCANKVVELSKHAYYFLARIDAFKLLADVYRTKNNSDSVLKFLDLSIATKDSIFSVQKMMQIQDASMQEQMRQMELAEKERQLRNRTILYCTIALLIVFLLIAFILWRNNLHRRKAYVLLQKQKQETDNQKSKAEQTLAELRNTQSQLIHSEKMASLGELTAGIAHEIQNPLNFVNNFSDLNTELVDELKEELKTGNFEEANFIADDIRTNNEKISHHGKRAESIVTGMLQHSRTSTGQKEPTDINKLADEYLRLAYHGMQAKNKDFNCDIVTEFDDSIEKINIIPQDIGRVLLNLYNNAFYATNQKEKDLGGQEHYVPTVTVVTKKINDKPDSQRVEIKVKDNGNGIPQKIVDKIFQPFFTTKPTGQGTGLGLSLSYDIVKAHGGEIKVVSPFAEASAQAGGQAGTEFTIQLPINCK